MNASSGTGDESRHRGYISIQAGDPRSVDFLASMGWHLKTDPAVFAYQGDVIINDDFVVARYSHGPGVVEYRAPKDLPKGSRTMIHACLSGSETLHSTTGSAVVKPLSIIRIMPENFTGSECETTATSLFVIYRSADADKYQAMLAGESDEVYLRVLNAAASSLLHSIPDHPGPGFSQIQRGLEELAKAVAIGADLDSGVESDSLTTMYLRAMALIGSTATDETTTVESIAQGLEISRSYLLRAFKAQGTSPSREIRRERLVSAKRLLKEDANLVAAAAGSGFGSVRNLKRALSRDIELQ